MADEFLLSMSYDGLTLAERGPGGDAASGRVIGTVALDSPDWSRELADLRRQAEPDGAAPRTVLVLPDDQVRLMLLPGDEPDDAVAARWLDGATPYPVSALAWGHARVAGALQLAAVAKETLAEAEAFARAHGFEPIGFAARPAAWNGQDVWLADVAQSAGEPSVGTGGIGTGGIGETEVEPPASGDEARSTDEAPTEGVSPVGEAANNGAVEASSASARPDHAGRPAGPEGPHQGQGDAGGISDGETDAPARGDDDAPVDAGSGEGSPASIVPVEPIDAVDSASDGTVASSVAEPVATSAPDTVAAPVASSVAVAGGGLGADPSTVAAVEPDAGDASADGEGADLDPASGRAVPVVAASANASDSAGRPPANPDADARPTGMAADAAAAQAERADDTTGPGDGDTSTRRRKSARIPLETAADKSEGLAEPQARAVPGDRPVAVTEAFLRKVGKRASGEDGRSRADAVGKSDPAADRDRPGRSTVAVAGPSAPAVGRGAPLDGWVATRPPAVPLAASDSAGPVDKGVPADPTAATDAAGVPEPVFASRSRPSLTMDRSLMTAPPPRLGGTADLAANPARQRVEPTVSDRSPPLKVGPDNGAWAVHASAAAPSDTAQVHPEAVRDVVGPDHRSTSGAREATLTAERTGPAVMPAAPVDTPRRPDPRLMGPTHSVTSAKPRAVGAAGQTSSDPFEDAARRGGWLAATGPHARPGAWRLALALTVLLIAALVAVALFVPSANAAVRSAWARMTGAAPVAVSTAEDPDGAGDLSAGMADTVAVDVPVATSPAAATASPAPVDDVPTVDDAALADAATLLASALSTHATERAAAVPRPAASDLPVTAISPQEAERVYAATGIWLRAPRLTVEPDPDRTAPAPVVSAAASRATRPGLEGGTRADMAFAAPITPPLPGTTYTLDTAGRIAATPEGVIAPSGVRLIAGVPSLVPPTRPGTVAPEPAPEPATEPAPETAPEPVVTAAAGPDPAATPPADPAPSAASASTVGLAPGAEPPPVILATAPGPLPPTRNDAAFADRVSSALASAGPDPATALSAAPPDSLVRQPAPSLATLTSRVPPSRPADRDPAALAPAVTAKFEGPRPPGRPDSVVAAAQAVAPAETVDLAAAAVADALANPAAAASTQGPATVQTALAGILAGAPDPLAGATASAVRTARRPDVRPAAFDRAVSAQLASAAAATAAPAPAATGTPEAVEATEPESASNAAAVPSGPTAASVAQVATVSGAISLRQMNVIGIYGQPGAQTALVRMGNGRMVRVSVGDSLDGGQVVAIQDNALQLARGGRTELLVIPGL